MDGPHDEERGQENGTACTPGLAFVWTIGGYSPGLHQRVDSRHYIRILIAWNSRHSRSSSHLIAGAKVIRPALREGPRAQLGPANLPKILSKLFLAVWPRPPLPSYLPCPFPSALFSNRRVLCSSPPFGRSLTALIASGSSGSQRVHISCRPVGFHSGEAIDLKGTSG